MEMIKSPLGNLFEKSETTAELYATLAKARPDFPDLPKDKKADYPTSSGGRVIFWYTDLRTAEKLMGPVLAKHGLFVSQRIASDGQFVYILTTLSHGPSGQWIASTFMVKAGNRMQEIGASVTYARRYMYFGTLGISSDEDTDAQDLPGHSKQSAVSGSRGAATTNPPSVAPRGSEALPIVKPKAPSSPLVASKPIPQGQDVIKTGSTIVEPIAEAGGSAPVTQFDVDRLNQIRIPKGWTGQHVVDYIAKAFQVDRPSKLNRAQYRALVDVIKAEMPEALGVAKKISETEALAAMQKETEEMFRERQVK